MTYDASGNLTYDTFHTYTWNEFNKLSTIDSSACGTHGQCITYDALGRAVETSNGANYTEIWYTQLGKTAYMTGSTLKYAYWNGPGGGTLFQPNGNNYWEHKDWLGNARISSNLATTIIDDRAFAPYGEMYDNFGSTSANELIFTGDLSNILPSVLYDTENRELNPSQGRWLSPDPAVTGWNQYAYGTDPNTQTDPTGMWITGASFEFLNEGLRGPFNAGMDVFPGMDQGNFSPVPADEGCNSCTTGYTPTSSSDDSSEQNDCWCGDPTQDQKSADQTNQDEPNQPQPSWDKSKPQPDDPSELGPDWRKNPDYKNPHGEEYINDKTGEKMEWNKGRPGPWGPNSDRGSDGWHYTPPGGERGPQLAPGEMIKSSAIITIGIIINFIVETAPEWGPVVLAF